MQVVIFSNWSATKLGLVIQVTNGSREQATDHRVGLFGFTHESGLMDHAQSHSGEI